MKVRYIGESDPPCLIKGKVYEVIEEDEDGYYYSVIDETGEDYIYDAEAFEIVEE